MKKIFTLIALIALAGCGNGVHLGTSGGSGNSGNANAPQSLPLALAYGFYGTTSSPGLGGNPISAGFNVTSPSAPFGTAYTAAELTAMRNPANGVPVRKAAAPSGFYQVATFCFDVSAINLANYRSIHLTGAISGGTSSAGAGAALDGASFVLAPWSATGSSYPVNAPGSGFALTSVDLRTDASLPPVDAPTPVNGGGAVTQCLFVTVIGTGASAVATTYSILDITWIGAQLDP
jgi:hypothetical protein